MQVCQFQKDREEQARCGFLLGHCSKMSTADIVAMKVCQFQKDRDEQARCAGEMSTADVVAMKVRQFQKDRDEQAWCEFKRVLSMNTRIVIAGVVRFCFLHLHGCTVRRGYFLSSANLQNRLFYCIYTWRVQRSSHEANFAPNPQTTDGETANPGPPMCRRGPRSADAIDRRASRQRLSSAPVSDSNFDWKESRFRMLHINIRGWTSQAAELTARIRQMDENLT